MITFCREQWKYEYYAQKIKVKFLATDKYIILGNSIRNGNGALYSEQQQKWLGKFSQNKIHTDSHNGNESFDLCSPLLPLDLNATNAKRYQWPSC